MKCFSHALFLLLCSTLSAAAIPTMVDLIEPDVRVCPARTVDQGPPDFGSPTCSTMPLAEVDPQQRHLWLSKTLSISPDAHENIVGLLISAKASSVVYLNGVRLGSNGRPGDNGRDEIAGQMDTVLPIPPALLKAGENQLALRISSHQGWLHLEKPIHALKLVSYLNEQDQILRRYLPALLPLGAFVLASFFFAAMALRSERKLIPTLLTMLSVLPALQLLIEVSRALVAYRYPLQDVRLIGIVVCSMLFGLCLVVILSLQFATRFARVLAMGSAIVMAVAIAWVSDMDGKASGALLVASVIGFAIAAYGVKCRAPGAYAHACALALFAALNLWAKGMFLDFYFFCVFAALLVFHMIEHARSYVREVQLKNMQRARADRLEAALADQAPAQSDDNLTVVSLGKLRRVAVSSIARIQGAGDYAELHLIGGENLLHAAGLHELEAQLPNYFLRVHRSHIVNTRLVDRLQQTDGGTGTLFLRHGHSVPVSRRTMPSVRKALK
jgi:LytTr DNA-binding domain